jgi:hypothetical protein
MSSNYLLQGDEEVYNKRWKDWVSARQMKMLATVASYINGHKPGGLVLSWAGVR